MKIFKFCRNGRRRVCVIPTILLLTLTVATSSCDSHSHSTARQKVSDEKGHSRLAYGEIYYRLLKDTNATVASALKDTTERGAVTNIICPIHQMRYAFSMETEKWRDRDRYSKEIAVFCPQPHHGFYLAITFNGSHRTPKQKPNVN
jgi:hypothetical protein